MNPRAEDRLRGAKSVLGFVLNLATRVWPDGMGQSGETFEQGWRRKVGGSRPKPAPLALYFYPGGLVVVVRRGRAIELRKLPRSNAAQSALETVVGEGGRRIADYADRTLRFVDDLVEPKDR